MVGYAPPGEVRPAALAGWSAAYKAYAWPPDGDSGRGIPAGHARVSARCRRAGPSAVGRDGVVSVGVPGRRMGYGAVATAITLVASWVKGVPSQSPYHRTSVKPAAARSPAISVAVRRRSACFFSPLASPRRQRSVS